MQTNTKLLKNKAKKIEEKVKNGKVQSFNWGWFKFCKCIIGIFLYSLAVNLFVVPNNLYTVVILGLLQII